VTGMQIESVLYCRKSSFY